MRSITYAKILFAVLFATIQTNGQRRAIIEDLFTDQIFEVLARKEINHSSVSHFLSKIGNHKAALRFSNKAIPLGFDTITSEDLSYYSDFKAFDALQKIPTIADDYQVLMINEDHGNAQHRVFTKNLLNKLYQKGYRYLFLEGLSTQNGTPRKYQDTMLRERKYPLDIPQSGTYAREPQFSNMIRHAYDVGYEVLPYDGRGKNRENESVINISKILKINPEVKVIIHCGYGHIYEDEFMNSNWLGKKIKDSLGIDPLTIDQVILTEIPAGIESPFFTMMDYNKPTIFIDAKNNTYNGFIEMKHFDLLLYHPRTRYTFNRPNWLIQQKEHQLIEVKSDISEFPILIKAFKFTDEPKAVPIDTIEKKTEKDSSYLVLPKGKYRVELISKNGLLETKTIVVN